MKQICILLITLALCFGFAGTGFAAEAGLQYNANTGDADLNMTLNELNMEARANISGFVHDLSIHYGVPERKIETLVYEKNMAPADVYMTVGLAELVNAPITDVAQKYEANPGKGWGVIAKEMGIKPGSSEFHALKRGCNVELKKAKNRGPGKAKGKWKNKGMDKGKGKGRGQGKN